MERTTQASRRKKLFGKLVASETEFLAMKSPDVFSMMMIGDDPEEKPVSLSAIESAILDSSANAKVVAV